MDRSSHHINSPISELQRKYAEHRDENHFDKGEREFFLRKYPKLGPLLSKDKKSLGKNMDRLASVYGHCIEKNTDAYSNPFSIQSTAGKYKDTEKSADKRVPPITLQKTPMIQETLRAMKESFQSNSLYDNNSPSHQPIDLRIGNNNSYLSSGVYPETTTIYKNNQSHDNYIKQSYIRNNITPGNSQPLNDASVRQNHSPIYSSQNGLPNYNAQTQQTPLESINYRHDQRNYTTSNAETPKQNINSLTNQNINTSIYAPSHFAQNQSSKNYVTGPQLNHVSYDAMKILNNKRPYLVDKYQANTQSIPNPFPPNFISQFHQPPNAYSNNFQHKNYETHRMNQQQPYSNSQTSRSIQNPLVQYPAYVKNPQMRRYDQYPIHNTHQPAQRPSYDSHISQQYPNNAAQHSLHYWNKNVIREFHPPDYFTGNVIQYPNHDINMNKQCPFYATANSILNIGNRRNNSHQNPHRDRQMLPEVCNAVSKSPIPSPNSSTLTYHQNLSRPNIDTNNPNKIPSHENPFNTEYSENIPQNSSSIYPARNDSVYIPNHENVKNRNRISNDNQTRKEITSISNRPSQNSSPLNEKSPTWHIISTFEQSNNNESNYSNDTYGRNADFKNGSVKELDLSVNNSPIRLSPPIEGNIDTSDNSSKRIEIDTLTSQGISGANDDIIIFDKNYNKELDTEKITQKECNLKQEDISEEIYVDDYENDVGQSFLLDKTYDLSLFIENEIITLSEILSTDNSGELQNVDSNIEYSNYDEENPNIKGSMFFQNFPSAKEEVTVEETMFVDENPNAYSIDDNVVVLD